MLNKEKIMYKYKVQVKKVSGRLNESVLPSKNLVIKTKTKKSDKEVFAEASKYFKKKYGLVIESADVTKLNESDDWYKEMMEAAKQVAFMFVNELGAVDLSPRCTMKDVSSAVYNSFFKIDFDAEEEPYWDLPNPNDYQGTLDWTRHFEDVIEEELNKKLSSQR